MVQLVAERGYEQVTVRDLAYRARVSTRTFYERFQGKQECLLDAYDEIMHRAARLIAAPPVGQPGGGRPSELALAGLAAAAARNPEPARFVCLDASAAGLGLLERISDAHASFESVVIECLGDAESPPLRPALAKAIVSGIAQVFSTRLADGRESELPTLVDDLLAWARSLRTPGVAELDTLGISTLGDPAAAAAALTSPRPAEAAADSSDRERDLILAATIQLAANEGYWQLSVPRIRAAAGLSRRRFDGNFASVEECFVAALELLGSRMMSFTRAQSEARGRDWPMGFHHAVSSLCAYAATDPVLARLVLVEVFASGPQGLRHLSHLIATTAEGLRAAAPAERRPSLPVAEAAMGATWGIVRHCVATRRRDLLRQLAPLFSFLALSPSIGARAALDAINAEELRAGRRPAFP